MERDLKFVKTTVKKYFKTVTEWFYKTYIALNHKKLHYMQCATPTKVRGRSWNFGILGEDNIFDFRDGGCPMREGLYFLGEGQFILCSFSHFKIQDFKNSKRFDCSALIFNIHIFRFKTDATKPVKLLLFLSTWWVKRAL